MTLAPTATPTPTPAANADATFTANAAANTPLDTTALRNRLAQRLPDYMLPTAIIALDHLPLNANGKLDRKSLPEPDHSAPTQSHESPRRRNRATQIAAIWCEVLGLDRINRHDNFFAIGGHSLAVIRAQALFTERHGSGLKIQMFFAHPTLSQLAAVVAEGRDAAQGSRAHRLSEMSRLMDGLEVTGHVH